MNQIFHSSSLWTLLLLLGGALFGPTSGIAADVAPPPEARALAPQQLETLVNDDMSQGSWTYGGGLLYWTNNCAGSVDPVSAYLKRHAENGWVTLTIDAPTQCAALSNDMIADETGVYYWNYDNNDLEARLSDDVSSIVKIADIAPVYPMAMALDDLWIYYTQPNGIYRTAKGLPISFPTSNVTNVTGLAVDADYLYWLDDSGLWRSDKTCITPGCWNAKELLATPTGRYLAWQESDTLIWTGSDTSNWSIYAHQLGGAGAETYHTAPRSTTAVIGHAIVHDDTLYWLERFSGGDVRLRRKSLPGSTVENLADGLWTSTPHRHLAAGQSGILFADANNIYRVPYNSAPVTRDLAVTHWEITQGIQSMENDVRLSADKATYVRVYASLITGTQASGVTLQLRGFHNDNEITGSPLQPLNGPWNLKPGTPFERNAPTGYWLFKLPDSWVRAGTLKLTATIDPQNIYDDANMTNNSLSDDFGFFEVPPTCLRFVPVWTQAGVAVWWQNPYFGNMVDLYDRLWPSGKTHIFHRRDYIAEWEFCWDGLICDGPYELPDDTWKVMTTLTWHDTFSSDPAVCDNYGGRTHWIGMVDPHSDTEGILGTGRLGYDQLWFKLPDEEERPPREKTWAWPARGQTLAHELGHNYDRRHVNCPVGDPENIDHGYPYATTCALDDGALAQSDPNHPTLHYGFDVNSLSLISPTEARDLMAYGYPRWISDYTWNAIGMEMLLPSWPLAEPGSAAPTPDLSATDQIVWISGIITESAAQGQLEYAWVFPTNSLGEGLLRKWQTLAAPQMAQPNATASNQAAQYHLRLLGSGGTILDVREITLTATLDMPQPYPDSFQLTFPQPLSDVTQIELLINDTVVDKLTPGASVPEAQIRLPAGGVQLDEALVIAWQANDADTNDHLHHSVQYSPDAGQSWLALAANLSSGTNASESFTLTLNNLADLPGDTDTALIRIAVSDGYHTAIATSKPFALQNQAPQPYIVAPLADHWQAAGQTTLLRGWASDPEEGNLSGPALSWHVDADSVGNGEELALQGLAPGSHTLSLSAQDNAGETGSTQATLNISPLHINTNAAAPHLDGLCDDEAYAGSPPLRLAPYSDGTQSAVYLTRSADDMWACFSGLQKSSAGLDAFVGMRVDVDHSRDNWAQNNDYGFFIKEEGTPFSQHGDGSGGFESPGPSGWQARIYAQNTTWSAELRIGSNTLNGWNHLVGLEVGHYDHNAAADNHLWPYSANNQPTSWANTVLGEPPQIKQLLPQTATAGSAALALFVEGESFANGATLLWNGEPRESGFLSEQYLTTLISSSELLQPGVVTVSVVNPGLDAAPSPPQYFTIKSPQPGITSLNPVSNVAGGPAFNLTLHGAEFFKGATVLWNGQARPTTFLNSAQLRAAISAEDIANPHNVKVSVLNPTPTAHASPTLNFWVVVEGGTQSKTLYLPVILR